VDDQASVELLEKLRQGDKQAAEQIYCRFVERLIAFAGSRLSPIMASRFDPEDVVQSVFRSLSVRAREGKFVVSRNGDLWKLLVSITINKLRGQIDRHSAAKRRVGREVSVDSLLRSPDLLREIATQDPSPADAAELVDEVRHLMKQLEPDQRTCLELRLQGFSLEEIAMQTDCSERTVRRVMDKVKRLLESRMIVSHDT
jgi:RNA polymerase sigma factor (sigma-70 family)